MEEEKSRKGEVAGREKVRNTGGIEEKCKVEQKTADLSLFCEASRPYFLLDRTSELVPISPNGSGIKA